METHTRKLLLHRFYADVNVKGGLGFCRALALFMPCLHYRSMLWLCNNTIYSRSREGKILQTDLLQ